MDFSDYLDREFLKDEEIIDFLEDEFGRFYKDGGDHDNFHIKKFKEEYSDFIIEGEEVIQHVTDEEGNVNFKQKVIVENIDLTGSAEVLVHVDDAYSPEYYYNLYPTKKKERQLKLKKLNKK